MEYQVATSLDIERPNTLTGAGLSQWNYFDVICGRDDLFREPPKHYHHCHQRLGMIAEIDPSTDEALPCHEYALAHVHGALFSANAVLTLIM